MSDSIVIGLTGQTGAGKSSVRDIVEGRGAFVIDCDQVSRDVVDEQKQCLADLALEFGIEILKVDGTLNRGKLADIAFSDKQRLKRLNAIIFPYILDDINRRIEEAREAGEEVVLLDAPTLFEAKADQFCDTVLSVIAPENERLNRIVVRDRLTDEQARTRMGAQHNDEYYTSRSSYVIVNDSDLQDLRLKTIQVYDQILKDIEKCEV